MADGKYLIGESLREKLKSTIAKVDSIPFGGPVSRIPTVIEGDGQSYAPKVFRVCTAAGAWSLDTLKTVTFYGVTATPNTVSAINKIVSLPAPRSTATSRIVNIAKDGTQWYLVSFQMSAATGAFSTSTQSITFIGPNATQSITFASANSSAVTVITDVSAVFNTSSCSITLNKTTASLQVAGPTQTATVVAISGTQTATVVAGTFTATFVSLEI
jgi:hypothetical protein